MAPSAPMPPRRGSRRRPSRRRLDPPRLVSGLLASGLLALLVPLLLPFAVEAQAPPRPPANLVIGGVARLPDYVGSPENRILPFPVASLALGGARLEFGNLDARLDLLGRRPLWRVGPVVTASLPRSEVEDAVLAALPEVDLGLEVGVHAGRSFPIRQLAQGRLDLDVAVRRDVVGAHEGTLITPEVETLFSPSRRVRLSFRAATTWASASYMDAYFGVDADGAASSGLARYAPGGGVRDLTFSAFSLISFRPRWGLLLRWEEMLLIGDAADSPVFARAGEPAQRTLGIGLSYAF